MQWVDNVRSLYQFNADLCLQQLDSEVPLRGRRLSGLHSVAQGVRVGSYRSCQWLANEVTRWTGSVQCRKGVIRTGRSPSFILCLGDVIWCLHILFLLFSIETRSWDKKTRITFQLGGVSVAVICVKLWGGGSVGTETLAREEALRTSVFSPGNKRRNRKCYVCF